MQANRKRHDGWRSKVWRSKDRRVAGRCHGWRFSTWRIRLWRIGVWRIGVWLAAAWAAPSFADTGATAMPAAVAGWAAVDDAALDGARGGFTAGNGLSVSLGIDRLVSINGDVVARSSIDIADLGRIGAEQARQTSAALSSIKLVQNGGENIYRAGEIGSALGGIIVQNSLNNQLIRTDTVIRSTVNSAGLLSALNFQGSLQDSLTRAVTSPR